VTAGSPLALFAVLCAALCSGSATAKEPDVFVSTAVSLKEPLVAAIADFRDSPGVQRKPTIRIHAGGSVVLAQQILRGAPSDLFLSASRREIERLMDAGLIDSGSTCTLAGNTLVVVVPIGGGRLDALRRLADPRFARIGVANPQTAPLGRYTQQVIEATELQQRLGNRLILAEHARQVIDYVARGEVDAALVYATDARRFADRVSVALEIDPDLHEPIEYRAALVGAGAPRFRAEQLFEFLCSDAGRARFVESGLRPWPGTR